MRTHYSLNLLYCCIVLYTKFPVFMQPHLFFILYFVWIMCLPHSSLSVSYTTFWNVMQRWIWNGEVGKTPRFHKQHSGPLIYSGVAKSSWSCEEVPLQHSSGGSISLEYMANSVQAKWTQWKQCSALLLCRRFWEVWCVHLNLCIHEGSILFLFDLLTLLYIYIYYIRPESPKQMVCTRPYV